MWREIRMRIQHEKIVRGFRRRLVGRPESAVEHFEQADVA
jgi:hypothetical protein